MMDDQELAYQISRAIEIPDKGVLTQGIVIGFFFDEDGNPSWGYASCHPGSEEKMLTSVAAGMLEQVKFLILAHGAQDEGWLDG